MARRHRQPMPPRPKARMRRIVWLCVALCTMSQPVFSEMPSTPVARFQEAVGYGLPSEGVLLVVDVASQILTVMEAGRPVQRLLVSTAKAGIGNQAGSNKTPLGWHRVEERIGEGEPMGRVFRSRIPQNEVLSGAQLSAAESGDYVLTRILWLRGLQPGYNAGSGVDSHDRCIYVHGTNQEQLLGIPASHGCIRLSNRDVVALFERIRGRETWCLIQ